MTMFWNDWTYAMFWHDTLMVLVWVFLVTTIMTSIGHLITAWVTWHQQSITPLGPALTKRETALGIKSGLRIGFDMLLVLVVTWNVDINHSPFVPVIALPLICASLAVIWFMLRYLMVLRHESWGRPVAVTSFSEETADTIDQTADDVVEVKERVRRIETQLDRGSE